MTRAVLVWFGRACALVAIACFALTVVAIQRGRAVQSGVRRIVATIGATNSLYGSVDLTSADQTRAQLDTMATALGQLGDATHVDVDLLNRISVQVHTLMSTGNTDLGVSRALAATADAIARNTAGLRDVAVGGEPGAAQAASLLKTTSDLVVAINAELARLGQKLALMPDTGA